MDSSEHEMTGLADAGETAEQAALPRFTPRGVLRYALGRFNAWHQRRFARRGARLARRSFEQLRKARPGAECADLYAEFVRQRNAVDDVAARAVLRRAEQSFAAWPEDRDLNFQDVVKYVVIADYLATYRRRGGTTVDMGQVIGRIIPRTW